MTAVLERPDAPPTGGATLKSQSLSQSRRDRATAERRLVERYYAHGDLEARDALIRRFLPLARQLAARASRGDSIEDVFQVASVAVVKGIDRYDPARGAALSSYLVPTIIG